MKESVLRKVVAALLLCVEQSSGQCLDKKPILCPADSHTNAGRCVATQSECSSFFSFGGVAMDERARLYLDDFTEGAWTSAFGTSFVLVFAFLLPLFLLQQDSQLSSKKYKSRTLVVLGSGGHTTEMLSMLKSMPKDVVAGSVFIIASTDAMSKTKVDQEFPGSTVLFTPRAREVRQSWITRYGRAPIHGRIFANLFQPTYALLIRPPSCSVFTTFVAVLYALKTVFSERPDLVLCNGPGTCVPVAYAAWLMRILRVKSCSIVFTVGAAGAARAAAPHCRSLSLSLSLSLALSSLHAKK